MGVGKPNSENGEMVWGWGGDGTKHIGPIPALSAICWPPTSQRNLMTQMAGGVDHCVLPLFFRCSLVDSFRWGVPSFHWHVD